MTLYDFLSGAVAFGFAMCALFFLRFWTRTRDGLFLAFAVAFLMLGSVQAILALANFTTEEQSSVYLIRLGAFLIIIFAIVRKNRATI
jgi:membrane-associated PAP2 superfamily phosphatase